jgi:hypothetical protein
LADQALRSVGAKSAANYGTITPTANYRWGRQIQLTDLRAGDIIQFRNYQLVITTTTNVTNPDGSGTVNTQTETQSRPHHTAIVSVAGSNGEVTIYEQNVPAGSPIQSFTLHFTTHSSTHTTTSGGVTTTVTRSIQVHGTLWYYRPETG